MLLKAVQVLIMFKFKILLTLDSNLQIQDLQLKVR